MFVLPRVTHKNDRQAVDRKTVPVKTAYGVSAESYRSTLTELLFVIGQYSTAAMDIFGVLHGLVMHAAALAFMGILFLSVSGTLRHEIIGEGFIDDTGLGTTNPYSTDITSTKKGLTNEEHTLHKKVNGIIQFFLNLLHVTGGDLNTSKSARFILFHRWSGGKSSL
jgi:hypothetical protein